MLGEVLTAIVTPFREDGSIDFDVFRSLCDHLLDNGSDGLVVTGTTGEAPTLSDEERLALYATAIETVGGRGTVVAGTGTYATAHSVHLTEEAHELGVDGFLVVTPYYNKPPQRGIVAHLEAVAAATDKPVIFYDIPSRVVVDAEPETISRLAEIPNVRAVKQAKPSLDAARHVVACGLDLYAGDDDLILPFLEVGGVGDQALREQAAHLQLPQPLDVHRPARDEVLGQLPLLAGAPLAVGAFREHRALGLDGRRVAARAALRGPGRRVAVGALGHVRSRRQHLRDHVAGA